MTIYTTEITSDNIPSDNPIHQRLLKAYYLAKPFVHGDMLEVGCGEGRGVQLLANKAKSYCAVDKIEGVVAELSRSFPQHEFKQSIVPPLPFKDDLYDFIVSFQVIEHIKKDRLFLQEIFRVLKPGGTALITTPNKVKSLTRNPWHIREYTSKELHSLCNEIFDEVDLKGITGNDKIWDYYKQNKISVEKITRWDILNLQYRLPSFLLRLPYEFFNRLNRNKLESKDDDLVRSITHEDYLLSEDPESSLDLFVILKKHIH